MILEFQFNQIYLVQSRLVFKILMNVTRISQMKFNEKFLKLEFVPKEQRLTKGRVYSII